MQTVWIGAVSIGLGKVSVKGGRPGKAAGRGKSGSSGDPAPEDQKRAPAKRPKKTGA